MESSTQARRVRFGVFEADLHSGELHKNGVRVRLQEQPFQVLVMLLEHPGDLVTQQEIIRRLWPDGTVVEYEHSIKTAVKKLRQALGDDANQPRYVETLPRRGYRFIAPVEIVEPHYLLPSSERRGANADLPPGSGGNRAVATMGMIRESSQRRRWLVAAISGTAAILTAALVLGIPVSHWQPFPRPTPPTGKIRLVVLPFENLSGDPTQEYFSDGITEEMTAQLARLHPERLAVIGRTSAMTYKSTTKTIDQIGGELAVQYVLEGSVRRAGDRVRVTAQLIKVGEQTQVWAETYDRDLHDILGVQAEVARAVANETNIQLSSQRQWQLAAVYTPKTEAHEAYLRGRYFWGKRTGEDVQKGLEYFQQAVTLDPGYAAAYAGLADSHILLGPWTEARANAVKALAIDDTLAEAHTSLAQLKFISDWDWLGAEREFKRAIELDPNYAMAHHWYAGYLGAMGRMPEALAEAKRAQELEPLSLIISAGLGEAFCTAQQYDTGIAQLKKTLEMDPNFVPALVTLGSVYTQRGMFREAISMLEKATALSQGQQRAFLGWSYARAGRKNDALKSLREFEKAGFQHEDTDLALLYAELGENDKAFASLERAYQQREYDLLSIKALPEFDSLRSDPRFQDLLRSMNFPPS